MSKKKNKNVEVECECGCPDCHDPDVLTFWFNNENEIVIQGKDDYIKRIVDFIKTDVFIED